MKRIWQVHGPLPRRPWDPSILRWGSARWCISFGNEMGIKFLCPNGHKLNVKSFLSGKRAICPKCGARVVVPSVDAIDDAADNSVSDTSSSPGDSAGESMELPSTTMVQSSAAVASPSATRQSATAGAQHDVLAEDPAAVWYVRPATGGQFGPATSEIMRGWLTEGRVGGNALVWRTGWADWRGASEIFPELAGAKEVSGGVMGGAAAAGGATAAGGSLPLGHVVQSGFSAPAAVNPAGSGAVPTLTQTVRRRRKQRDTRMFMSAALGVIVVILAIILVIVFRSQVSPEITPDKAPAAQSPAS